MIGFPNVFQGDDDALKQVIASGNANFVVVLSHQSFWSLWMRQEPEIVEFVIDHFDDVIAHALQMSQPVVRNVTIRCMKIIVTDLPNARALIFEKTNIGPFFADFVTKEGNLDTVNPRILQAYFNILPAVAFDTNIKLCPALDKPEYFRTLCERVDILPIYLFLSHMLTHVPGLRVLRDIEYCGIFVNNLFKSLEVRHRSQRLLCRAFDKNCYYGIPNVFVTDESTLERVFRIAFDEKDVAIFDLLKRIVEKAECDNWSRAWKSVHARFVEKCDDFCDVILNDSGYTKNSDSCTRIVTLIFSSTNNFTPKIHKVVLHLTNLFFELSHNSFLHNSFVNFVTTLNKNKCITAELVKEMGICQKIVDQYEKRDCIVTSSNWGHMRLLSQMLDRHARLQIPAESWQHVVCDENQRKELIISKPYGRPKSTCRAVNYIFLGALVILLVAISIDLLI